MRVPTEIEHEVHGWVDREAPAEAPINAFSLNYSLLALSGIWPPDGLSRTALRVYVLVSAVAHTFFFYSSLTYVVALVNCDNMDTAIGACCDTFVIYLSNYKIFVLLKNKRLIRRLTETLKHDLDVTYAPLRRACREHDKNLNKLARKATGWYYAVLLSVDFTYIFMFLRAEFNGEARIPQWDPLSLRSTNSFTFFLYACVPVAAALMSGIHTTVFDTMILTFSLLLGAKIDNLASLLRTLEDEPGPGGGGRRGGEDSLELAQVADDDADRAQRLRDAILIHQRVIRFVDDLEQALSSLSLAQLLESLAAICLQGYRLTAAPPSISEGVPMINYLLWLLLQLWILCWSGENIATKSKSLATVAGRCHWLGASRHFQMDMRMVMLRAQRPLCLTAFKMVKLNYPVYLDIVKNSYSLYTCMLRMKSDNKKKRSKH